MKLKAHLFFIPVLTFSLVCLGFLIHFWLYLEKPGPLLEKKIVFIEKGLSLSKISEHLDKEGIISNPILFQLHTRLAGKAHKVRAGEFEIPIKSTPLQIISILVDGPFVQHSITVPEGLTVAEVIKIIEDTPLLKKEKPIDVKEGQLLPETYHYTWQDTSNDLLKRMQKSMAEALERTKAAHSDNPFLKSTDNVLILASIVEKETAKPDERARIAAVFLNRLKKGMKLQSDPTVIYGLKYELGKDINVLSKSDLEVPSSYNTYLHNGLPPTPICNPGISSIKAVLNPAETDDLYFVADGTGGHAFSKNYKEHASNHQKWRRIRKEIVDKSN